MKLFLASLVSLITGTILLFSTPALAVSVNGPCSNPNIQNKSASTLCNTPTPTKNPIILVLKTAIEIVSFAAGVAAVILIVVSAIKFMTSSGDSSAVASARSTIVYALVGILVVIMTQSIIAFVLNKL